jgi:hypothetical protein
VLVEVPYPSSASPHEFRSHPNATFSTGQPAAGGTGILVQSHRTFTSGNQCTVAFQAEYEVHRAKEQDVSTVVYIFTGCQ